MLLLNHVWYPGGRSAQKPPPITTVENERHQNPKKTQEDTSGDTNGRTSHNSGRRDQERSESRRPQITSTPTKASSTVGDPSGDPRHNLEQAMANLNKSLDDLDENARLMTEQPSSQPSNGCENKLNISYNCKLKWSMLIKVFVVVLLSCILNFNGYV